MSSEPLYSSLNAKENQYLDSIININ